MQLPEKILQFSSDVVVIEPTLNCRAATVKLNNNFTGRSLSANEQWLEIINCAGNPELQIIFFNGPEVRNDLVTDNIKATPPFSLPGKLLAFLFQRFNYFNGAPERGLVIISSEQTANAGTLEAIVLELAHLNNLEPAFLDWIENSIHFCNKVRN